MAEDIKITRTGLLPLTFRGSLLADVSGQWHNGQKKNRWHDLRVYRTEGGRYVSEIVYSTLWQDETDHHAAEVVDDARKVVEFFKQYEPTEHVHGYPPGEAYREKQGRLMDDLGRRYRDRLMQLYDELGEEFAERID